MRRLTVAIVAAMAAAGAVAVGATPQERAAKINKDLRRSLVWCFPRSGNPAHTKIWTLKTLAGKHSELVDYRNRCNCLKAAFAAAVQDLDTPLAACVLVRIRREIKGFSQEDEAALIEKVIDAAKFASDSGKDHFEDELREEIKRASSPAGYTLARMRTIRIEPFILRPPTKLADAVRYLNKKAPAADYVNCGMGVKFVLKRDGFDEDPPDLPKVQVGEYEYGNVGVTLEKAVKIIVGSIGYTFRIRPDGVVAIVEK